MSMLGHLIVVVNEDNSGLEDPEDSLALSFRLSLSNVYGDYDGSHAFCMVSRSDPGLCASDPTHLSDFGGLVAVRAHRNSNDARNGQLMVFDAEDGRLQTSLPLEIDSSLCYFESSSLLACLRFRSKPQTVLLAHIESEDHVSLRSEFRLDDSIEDIREIICNERFYPSAIIGGLREDSETIHLLDLEREGAVRWTLTVGKSGFVSALALDPVTGNTLLSSANHVPWGITFWDIRTLSETGFVRCDDISSSLLWHPDHPQWVVEGGYSDIHFYDVRNPLVPFRSITDSETAPGLELSLAHIDSNHFVSCSEYSFDPNDDDSSVDMKGVFCSWSYESGKKLDEHIFEGDSGGICFCPASEDGWIRRRHREDEAERVEFLLGIIRGENQGGICLRDLIILDVGDVGLAVLRCIVRVS